MQSRSQSNSDTATLATDVWPNDAAAMRCDRATDALVDALGPGAFAAWTRARPHLVRTVLQRFDLLPTPPQECAQVRHALAEAQQRGLRVGDRWFVVAHAWWQAWKAFVKFDGDGGDDDGDDDDEQDHGGGSGDARLDGDRQGLPSPAASTTHLASLSSSSSSSPGAAHGMSPLAGRTRASRPLAIDNSSLHDGAVCDAELRADLVEGVDFALLPEAVWTKLVGASE